MIIQLVRKKDFVSKIPKKMNCPAVMKVCRIIYFPEFCLKEDVTCFKRKKTEVNIAMYRYIIKYVVYFVNV